MRSFIVFVFICSSNCSYCQREANIWYFANQLGLDFSQDPVKILRDGKVCGTGCGMGHIDGEASSVMADREGNLLFYTDGVSVWNRIHEVMPNGEQLYGSGTTTQTVIVPDPGDENRYYIFTASPQGDDPIFPAERVGFHYSIVDMKGDAGMGIVSEKNVMLTPSTTEKVAATFHANGIDVWVMMHEWQSDAFKAFLVTADGIAPPVLSNVGTQHQKVKTPHGSWRYDNAIGQMKFSTDGSKLGVAIRLDNMIEVFNFEKENGKLSLHSSITAGGDSNFYGIEFSPNGNLLYATDGIGGIFQFDLLSSNVAKSKLQLSDVNTFNHQLQLGPDGRIYVALAGQYALGVVYFPDLLGASCTYNPKGIEFDLGLSSNFGGPGLPNFVSNYLSSDIVVPDDIFDLPNVFTPSGDTFNPNFGPSYPGFLRSLEMTIINRWGDVVAIVDDPKKGWSGDEYPAGIYFWFARIEGVTGKRVTRKGWVHLIR